MTRIKHKWGKPYRTQFKTERECLKCKIIKVTKHEPGAHYAWVEYWRDGESLGTERPDCVAIEARAA